MTPEEIAELRAAAVQRHRRLPPQGPLRPDGDAGEARLPAAAAPARASTARSGWGTGSRGSRAARRRTLKPGGRDRSSSAGRTRSVARSTRDAGAAAATSPATDWLEFYIVLVRENLDGRVPALTPRLFALKEGDRLNSARRSPGTSRSTRSSRATRSSSSAPAPARPRTTTCSGNCSAAGTRGRSSPRAASGIARDLGYLETHDELMGQFPNYKYLPLTTREPRADAEGLHPGPDHERGTGGAPRRGARPGDDARVPVRQPEDDRRPVKDKETGASDVPAAARRDRDPGGARVPGRRVGGEVQGEHPLRRILVTGGGADGGHQRDDRRLQAADAAPDRADVAGVRGGRADAATGTSP